MSKSSGWEIHLIKKPSQETWWIHVERWSRRPWQTPIHDPEDGLRVVKFLNHLLPEIEFKKDYDSLYEERWELEAEMGEMGAKYDLMEQSLADAKKRLQDISHAFKSLPYVRGKKRTDLRRFIKERADLRAEGEASG